MKIYIKISQISEGFTSAEVRVYHKDHKREYKLPSKNVLSVFNEGWRTWLREDGTVDLLWTGEIHEEHLILMDIPLD